MATGTSTAASLAAAIRPVLRRTLLAVDYDGTLAPIVDDPARAVPYPGSVEALAALRTAGASVVVITGRPSAVAVSLGSLDRIPDVAVHGIYGAELWHDGELTRTPVPPAVDTLRLDLPALLDGADTAVWAEDKDISIVLHSRRAADPEAALAAVEPAAVEAATRLGFELHRGRAVLEFRLPGYDKASVLRRVVTEHGPTALVYFGDDLGDLPAFEAVRDLRAHGLNAWSVAAASAETPEVAAAADVAVDGPAGVTALLVSLTTPSP